MPFVIGLTGRAGCGKSTVAAHWESSRSIHTIDLDRIGHECLKESAIIKKCVATFGDTILVDGHIDRSKLRQIVCQRSEALTQLNTIIHPQINRTVTQQLSLVDKTTVIIGALIDEIGLRDCCDVMVVIDRSDTDTLSSKPTLLDILPLQRRAESYRESANHVLQNNGTQSNLLKNADELFDSLDVGNT